MSFVGQSDFKAAGRIVTLRQGMIVDYEAPPKPHSVGRELSGPQKGVILSANSFLSSASNIVVIMPLLQEPSPVDGIAKITVTLPELGSYNLRPELTSSVGRQYVRPLSSETRNKFVSSEDLKFAIAAYKEIITCSPEKYREKARPYPIIGSNGKKSFLIGPRYAEARWFRQIPYEHDYSLSGRRPGICLTPPSIYERTGMILVADGFTNLNLHRPCFDVAVILRGFKPTTFKTRIQCLSLERLDPCLDNPRAIVDDRAMRACVKKAMGRISEAEYARTAARYSDEPGDLPSFMVAALHQQNDRPFHHR